MSKRNNQPRTEERAEQPAKDQRKEPYFYPSHDPEVPLVSVVANDREEADRLYDEQLTQHKENT